jgi:hypothetical protein
MAHEIVSWVAKFRKEATMSLFGKPSTPPQDNDDEEYTVVPVTIDTPDIPYEDVPQHNRNGFCGNMRHECHENQELIDELEQARQDGEVSDADAHRIYRGKTLGGW